jgi:hypothetical protein
MDDRLSREVLCRAQVLHAKQLSDASVQLGFCDVG